MDRTTFDDLAIGFGTGRLDRRQLVKRLLGIGLGATALAGGLTLGPGSARLAAACQWPFDPPPGWPDYLPWPCGPGPTFPLKVPASAEAAGIAFYVGTFDPGRGAGEVRGLDKNGNELRRFDFRQGDRLSIGYEMREGRTRLSGRTAFARTGDGGVRAFGEIDGQRFELAGKADGGVDIGATVELRGAKARLFAEFQLLAEQLIGIGRELAGSSSNPQAGGCVGCGISGAGLSLGAGGCALTGAAALACYGAWLVAAGVWVDECTGACA